LKHQPYDEVFSSRAFKLRHPGDALKDEVVAAAASDAGFHDAMILDVGCGMGHTSLCLSQVLDSEHIIGIDVSRVGLQSARSLMGGSFILADAASLPFKDGSFHYIIMKDVLEHVQDGQPVVQEAHRVLDSAGGLAIYVPHDLDNKCNISVESVVKRLTGYSIDKHVGHVRRYKKGEITAVLDTAGFREYEVFYYAHFLFGILSLAGVLGRSKVVRRKGPSRRKERGRPLVDIAYFLLVGLKRLGKVEFRLLRRCPGAGLFVFSTKTDA